jgi:hypothetical protein
MSSYLSRPYQEGRPSPLPNVDIVRSNVRELQTKYDQNQAIIESTIAKFDMIKLLRPEENEYLAGRLIEAQSAIDAYSQSNGDLSRNTTRDTMLSAFKGIYKDPIILNAIEQKTKYDNLNAEVAKRKEKNDGSYSDVNYQYSIYKGGVQDYMQGKTKKLGDLSYTPQANPQKELKDIADNIEKYDTEIEKTWTEDGYIYTQKGKVMSPDKLKAIAESFLTDGAKKQLTINGWASIHQGTTEEERMMNTKTSFEGFKTRTLENEREKVLLAEGQATKTGSETDKKNADIARENYSNLEKGLDDILKNGSAEQMYGTVYRESTLNNFANTFKYNTVGITDIKGDTTYMAKVKMNYDMQRDAIKDSQWQMDYNLKLRKEGLTTDENGNLVGDGSAFQTKADFGAEVPEAGNVQQQAFEEIDGLDKTITQKTTALFNTLDETTQQAIDLEVKNSNGTKTREDVLIEYSQGGKISHADANMLNTLIVDRYTKQEEYQKYKSEAEKEAEVDLDTPQMLKRLHDNPNIKIMWKGNVQSAKKVLQDNGIIDVNGNQRLNLKDNRKVFDSVKKSILADKALSATQVFDYKNYLTKLAESFGENINNILVKGETEYRQGTSIGAYSGSAFTPETLKPNSKTAQFLAAHKKGGAYNKAGIFSADDSFDDIPEVNSYFRKVSPQEIDLKIGQKIMANTKTGFGKVTTVKPGTPEYEDIAQQAGFEIKGTLPIELKKVPNQPNMIAITLGAGSSTKIKPTGIPNNQVLRIEDLSPRVLSQVNLYNTKPMLTLKNFPPVKQLATFSDIEGDKLAGFANVHFGGMNSANVAQASLVTKNGATSFYFNRYQEQLGTEDKPTPLGVAIKGIINSPDTYVEASRTDNADGVFIMPKIVKGDTTVFVNTPTIEGGLITEKNTDIAYKKMKFTPQTYINEYLVAVLNSKNQNQIDKLIKLYGE